MKQRKRNWRRRVAISKLPKLAFLLLGMLLTTNLSQVYALTENGKNVGKEQQSMLPTITCSPDIVVTAQNNTCQAVVTWTEPVAVDPNSTLTIMSTHNSGDTFPIGTTLVIYTATDTIGNVVTCSFNVTVNPVTLVVSLTPHIFNGGENIRCWGQYSGRVTCAVSGGCAPYTYSWSAGTPVVGGTISVGLPAGQVSLTVTDANGNSVTQSVTLTQAPALQSIVTWSPIPCYGGTATVSVTAAGGVAPYAGVTTFNNVLPGTHAYRVADANGCRNRTFVTITQPNILEVSAVPTPILCNGDSSQVTVSGVGGTIPYIGTGVYSEVAGVYNYTVTDSNGCTGQTQLAINQPGALSASISYSPILCNGETCQVSVNAVSGTEPYTGGGIYTELAGVRTYIVYDYNLCPVTVSVLVPEPAPLVATIISTPIFCAGGLSDITVTATGGSGPYTGTGVYPVTGGTHTYTVTDANGCSTVVSTTVTEPTALTASASSTAILCAGGTSDITVTATGGAAPYTGTGVYAVTAGTYIYTVTDANGCSVVVSTTVIAGPSQVTASATLTAILCAGGTSDITVTATGGTAPYTGDGVYSVTVGSHTYIVTDANGCSTVVSTTVTEPMALTASASSTAILCAGGTSDITVTATGGTAPYTGTGVYPVTGGTHTYTVTDANGCSTVVSTPVTEPTALIASASSTAILCNGGSSDITVTATGGSGPYTGTGVYAVTAGTYTYTVTDANGCSTVVSTTVIEPSVFAVSLSGCSTVYSDISYNYSCGTINSSITGGVPTYDYSWSTNEIADSIVVCPDSTTSYTLTVTDGNGCSTSAIWTVNALDISCTDTDSLSASALCGVSTESSYDYCTLPNDVDTTCFDVNNNNLAFGSVTNQVLMCYEGVTYCVSAEHISGKLACGYELGSCGMSQPCMIETPISDLDLDLDCECSGRLTTISVRYIGAAYQTINASAKDCGIPLGSYTTLNTGAVFNVNAVGGGLSYLRNHTYIGVASSPFGNVRIPTNCCHNPIGKVYFPFEVIGWVDTDGNTCGVISNSNQPSSMQTVIQAGKESGIDEQKATVSQYPNPASTSATFEFSVPTSEVVSLSIVGINGQLIETIASREVVADESYSVTYDVSELQSGIYFVHLTSSQGVVKKKFVVLK